MIIRNDDEGDSFFESPSSSFLLPDWYNIIINNKGRRKDKCMVKKKEAHVVDRNGLSTDEKEKLNEEVVNQINADYGSGSAFLLGSNAKINVQTRSTGSIVVDHILGGGLPAGRICEIYGPEASGKTSLALTAIANVQKQGGNAFFIDVEQALDQVYARVLGVDTAKLGFSQSGYAV